MKKGIPCKWKWKENRDGHTHIRQNRLLDLSQKLSSETKRDYRILKRWIPQEDIKILSIYAPQFRTPKYMKQILTQLKGEREIYYNTIVVYFNIPISIMYMSTRQNINKEKEDINNTIAQSRLTDIYRTLHPTTKEWTFFSNTNGTSSRPQNKS